MRAFDFLRENLLVELNLSRGPSGTQFPRGFDPKSSYGGMYPTGARFTGRDNFVPDLQDIQPHKHVKAIQDRIDGGMSLSDAVGIRAKQVNMNFDTMLQLYKSHKR